MVKQNFLFFKIKIAFIVIIKMLHSHYKKLKPYKKVRKKSKILALKENHL